MAVVPIHAAGAVGCLGFGTGWRAPAGEPECELLPERSRYMPGHINLRFQRQKYVGRCIISGSVKRRSSASTITPTVPYHSIPKRLADRLSHLLDRWKHRSRPGVAPPGSRTSDRHGATDQLAVIMTLAQEEAELIRDVLDIRFSGAHVPPERVASLRLAHRRGLAARRCCGDPALDAELGWLQGYGSFALMSDLSELDRERFERELAFRAHEIERAIDVRRARLGRAH